MNYFVYIHIFPNGKRYVGLTSQNPERRWGKGIGYKLYRRQYQLPVYHDTVSKHILLDTPFRGYIFKKAPLKEPN